MLVRLAELIAFIFIVWFALTQMIIPPLRGRKPYPMFRKEGQLKSDLEEVNQKVHEKKLEENIKTIKKEEGIE